MPKPGENDDNLEEIDLEAGGSTAEEKEADLEGEGDEGDEGDEQQGVELPPMPSSAAPTLTTTAASANKGSVFQPKKALYNQRDAERMHAAYSKLYDQLDQLATRDEDFIDAIHNNHLEMMRKRDTLKQLAARLETEGMGDINGGAPTAEEILRIPDLPFLGYGRHNPLKNLAKDGPDKADATFNYDQEIARIREAIKWLGGRKDKFDKLIKVQANIIAKEDKALEAATTDLEQDSFSWFFELCLCLCCGCCSRKSVQDIYQNAVEDLEKEVKLVGGTPEPDLRQAEDSGIIFG